MSSDCIRVSEAIWDFARDGVELAEDDLRHARACPSCSTALAQARVCIDALGRTTSCPAAPDCRSAVASRISGRQTRLLPAWSYACGTLLVAAVLMCWLAFPHQRPSVVEHTRPIARVRVTPKIASLPAHVDHRIAAEPPTPRHRPTPRRTKPVRWAKVLRHTVPAAVVPPAPHKPVRDLPKPESAPSAEDTSALAYVTWSTQPQESYDYSYTSTDPATGEVTKCSVKRDGNAIEINMESKPARSQSKPIKESKANETAVCG